MKVALPSAHKLFKMLTPYQQGCFNRLKHAPNIVERSEQNLQNLQFKLHNPFEPETHLNRPLSGEENALYVQMMEQPRYLTHSTVSPKAVALSGRLYSKDKLEEQGQEGYGLTRNSDKQQLNNTGFVFFNSLATGDVPDFSKHNADIFLYDKILLEQGYMTIMDGMGVYRMYDGALTTNHNNTLESVMCDGTETIRHAFLDKTTGKTTEYSITFGESHAFGPYIPHFRACLFLLTWRHLADDDKQAVLNSIGNNEAFAVHENRILGRHEFKIPGWVKLEGNIAAVSLRFQLAWDEFKNETAFGKYTAIEKERRIARQSGEYRAAFYE